MISFFFVVMLLKINSKEQWVVKKFLKISAPLSWANKQLTFSAHSQLITSISLDMMRLRGKSSPSRILKYYTYYVSELFTLNTFTSYNHNHNKIEHFSLVFFFLHCCQMKMKVPSWNIIIIQVLSLTLLSSERKSSSNTSLESKVKLLKFNEFLQKKTCHWIF